MAIGHFETVGLVTSADDLVSLLRETVGEAVGRPAADGSSVLAQRDESGATVVVAVAPDGSISCAKPDFRPPDTGVPNELVVTAVVSDPHCPHCDIVMTETVSGVPIGVELDAMALHRSIATDGPIRASFSLFAEQAVEAWPDEASFRSTGAAWAAASLVPTGLFAEEGTPPQARVMLHGRVLASHGHRNGRTGIPFWQLRVASHDDLVIDILTRPAIGSGPAPPAPGSVISASGWLVARVHEGAAVDQPTPSKAHERIGTTMDEHVLTGAPERARPAAGHGRPS